MSDNAIRLSFFKINVPNMDEALTFWRSAFGFEVRQTYDEESFVEHILGLPGQADGPNLMLVHPKVDMDLSVGPGHGPIGLSCDDILTTTENALAAGAQKLMEITEVLPGVRVTMLKSPQGHEIELVQLGG